jgi:hypothetical protein
MGGMTYALQDDPVRPLLGPGERTIWRGQPDAADYSLRGAWLFIPLSILWCAFAIFWEATAVVGGAPLFFALWGLPFVAIGLYLVFGRIFVARREARRTYYAITEQRVIIVSGAFGRRMVMMALEDLPPAQFDQRARGLGTITFGAVPALMRLPPGWPTWGTYAQPPAFASIPDAARVYRLLQETKAAARRG